MVGVSLEQLFSGNSDMLKMVLESEDEQEA